MAFFSTQIIRLNFSLNNFVNQLSIQTKNISAIVADKTGIIRQLPYAFFCEKMRICMRMYGKSTFGIKCLICCVYLMMLKSMRFYIVNKAYYGLRLMTFIIKVHCAINKE